jgi:DNA-binding NarL/FixJ family response regulator
MTKPRVLLADDHTLVLEGFRRMLESSCELVGMVEDGRQLVDAALRLDPDLVILDISMPLLNGIDAARQIKRKRPHVKLLFITMHADTAYLKAAFKAGASGYLLKRSASDELDEAIRSVMKGHYYVTPLVTRDVIDSLLKGVPDDQSPDDPLTFRQREILQLVGEGRSAKEIARLLNVSPRTVEFHKAQVMEKLNLHTTAELVKYAIAHGLISPS